MSSSTINNLLIPTISKIPGKSKVTNNSNLQKKDEFQKILKSKVQEGDKQSHPHGVKLSKHAETRLIERSLNIDNNEFLKIREALDKLKVKGGKDSLVITNNAAYIVDVNNDKVITAIDKGNMGSNVFTKIDSTVFIN